MPVKKINLVINGRGPQGPAAIGVLQILEERGYEVDKFAGASVGAMLGLLYAIGWTTEQLKELAGQLAQFLDKSGNPIRNINRFLHKHGYFKGKRLHEWIQEQVYNALGDPNATFKDLHEKVQEIRERGGRNPGEPRCDIFMQVSNVTDEVGILLSHNNFGETPLADALSASTRIIAGYPWINVKKGVDGEFLKNPDGSLRRYKPDDPGVISLVDSGITKNYPIDFDDHGFKNKNTIGIFLHKCPDSPPAQDFFLKSAVMGCIAYCTSTLRKSLVATGQIINTLRKSQYSASDEFRTIHVEPTPGVGLLKFNLTEKEIAEMIRRGRKAATDFLDNLDKPPEILDELKINVPIAKQKKWEVLWNSHGPSGDYLSRVTHLLSSETRGWYDFRFWGCCCRREKNSAERLIKYLHKPKWGDHFEHRLNLIKYFEQEVRFFDVANDKLDNTTFFELLTFLIDKLKFEPNPDLEMAIPREAMKPFKTE